MEARPVCLAEIKMQQIYSALLKIVPLIEELKHVSKKVKIKSEKGVNDLRKELKWATDMFKTKNPARRCDYAGGGCEARVQSTCCNAATLS